jgi:hypothetical protein
MIAGWDGRLELGDDEVGGESREGRSNCEGRSKMLASLHCGGVAGFGRDDEVGGWR